MSNNRIVGCHHLFRFFDQGTSGHTVLALPYADSFDSYGVGREARYVAEHPIIVTSNYAPSELAQRLGHDDPVIGLRIVSRLTEAP